MNKAPVDISRLIEEAKEKFGLTEASHELIRHNENITCKITDADCAYVLRIHRPCEGFSTKLLTGSFTDVMLMQSEIDLLLYMRGNGMDMLQLPQKNTDGSYISVLSDDSPAMLLTWIDGRPITREEAELNAKALGELAVRIHHSSIGYRGIRIKYDTELCNRLEDEIRLAEKQEHIPADIAGICINELEAVRKEMIRSAEHECGLIHADLGLGNILVCDKGLVPIDFSLSGYGAYAQEAGQLFSGFNDSESRKNVLAGIREKGENVSLEAAELFLSFSVLLFISSQHSRYYKEEWFKNSLNTWSSNLFVHR